MNYYQRALENQQLEVNIASQWGYQLKINQFNQPNKNTQTHHHILSSIQPLQVKSTIFQPNSKIAIIQNQIQTMRNQRKLDNQSTSISDRDIIKKLNDLVQEQNFYIDHRHIQEKDSIQSRRILKVPKSDVEIVLDQINLQKQLLINNKTLIKQFKANKQINQLYRKFKHKMFQLKKQPPKTLHKINNPQQATNKQQLVKSNQLIKSSLIEQKQIPANKSKSNIFQSIKSAVLRTKIIKPNKNQVKSHRISLSETKIDQNLTKIYQKNENKERKQSVNQQSKQYQLQSNSNIIFKKTNNQTSRFTNHSSYKLKNLIDTSRQFIQKGKQMDQSIKYSRQVMESWKSRLQQVAQDPILCKQIKEKIGICQLNTMNEERKYVNQSKLTEQIQQNKGLQYKKYISYRHQIRQKKKFQLKLVANFLQKRNCRFIKQQGMKILTKYDSLSQAKLMFDSELKRKKQNFSLTYNTRANKTKEENYHSFLKDDQKYCQLMSKNQKINIFMRNHSKK